MKLKIGIIGYGELGKRHYNELWRSDKFDVCGVFDPKCQDDFCRAPFFGEFRDFIQTAKPTAIALCVPPNELMEAFSQCVKHCKNIMISRPFFKNVSEAKELKYLAGVNKTRVCAGVCERFNPVIVSLLRALAKEDEIYSISIVNFKPQMEADIFRQLSTCDIDVAKVLANSEIYEFACSSSNRTNAKSSDNALIKFKSKNQILISISNSLSSAFERHCIEVNAKNGVYFGDLINLKLHQLTPDGQMNLKINADENEIKAQYEAFYELCTSGENAQLATLDDIIKIKELFA